MESKSYTYHQHRDIKLARKRLLSKQEDKNMTVNGVQKSESSPEHSLVDVQHTNCCIGGVGINYAIQDAVVAANVLSIPLKNNHLHLWDLAEVQRQRELPTRIIQAFQSFMQEQIIKGALDSDRPFTPPAFLQLPLLRNMPARLIGFGLTRVRVEN